MIKQLSEAFGVSGLERDVRELIISEISNYSLNIKTDKLGNLIVRCNDNADYPTIILCAHMDEPGLIITDITDDGYLKFDAVGNIDAQSVISKRVKIGNISGIISLKAIHLTKKSEREKPISLSDLFIDIGASSKSNAEEVVQIGDYCAFDEKFSLFGASSIIGKALPSRVGCSVLIDLIKYANNLKISVICIFAVQREIGSRGMRTALGTINSADAAIILDAVEACPNSTDNAESGKGVVICHDAKHTAASKALNDKLIELAEEKGITHQRKAIKTDSTIDAIRICAADIPTVSIGIPCRYMKSPTGTMDKLDIKSAEELIYSFLREAENGYFE